ncbi:MAG: metalloenzyme [Myxococcota bacterium]
MRVAILFTDGVGVGPREPATNPLAAGDYLLSQFDDGSGTALPHGGARHDVDTTFGVPGRPQSATNQTAIFTTRPAPQLLGRHVLGYPTRELQALLAEHSIVRTLVTRGRTATFANAYPVDYLDALGLARRAGEPEGLQFSERLRRKLKPSASTLAMSSAQVPLRTLADARRDEGLTHDIDGSTAGRRRLDVPSRTPAEAAEIFWNLAADFTLFEHYLADEAGHLQDRAAAIRALETFDAFARAVLARRPPDAHVLVCSDHGNVEDLSSRSHTLNDVAVLSFGPGALPPLASVADVGRAALSLLGVEP